MGIVHLHIIAELHYKPGTQNFISHHTQAACDSKLLVPIKNDSHHRTIV